MAREPNWEKWEFEIVMNNPELTDGELEKKLPRSLGAIRTVRVGIHIVHTTGENQGKFLSQMMLDILKEKQHTIKCPKCGKEF